jgi:hypothetical protein
VSEAPAWMTTEHMGEDLTKSGKRAVEDTKYRLLKPNPNNKISKSGEMIHFENEEEMGGESALLAWEKYKSVHGV